MRNKILITAIVAVLGGFTGVSSADSSFVNVDYNTHAGGTGGTCAQTAAIATQAGVLDPTGNPDGTLISTDTGELGTILTQVTTTTTTTTKGCEPKTITDNTLVLLTTALPNWNFNDVVPTVGGGIIDSDPTKGRAYAVEILQSGTGTLPSGTDGTAGDNTPKYAGVVYTTDGWITQKFELTFELSDGVFAEEPSLAIINSDVAPGESTATGYTPFTAWSRTSSGSGKNKVIFSIDTDTATTKGAPNSRLNHKSQILLLYRLKDATALETAGGSVTMSAKLQVVELQAGAAVVNDINRPLETVIATSTDTLNAQLSAEEGTIFISVNDDSKLFTDGGANTSTAGAFRNTSTARIGYLKISKNQAFQPDGVNLFAVGSGLGLAGEATDLVISANGQFAASKASPGAVRLYDPNDGSTQGTLITSAVSSDGETVTLKLNDTMLQQIVNSTNSKGVAIEFLVDQTTEINVVDDPPLATFNLVFDNTDIVVGDDLQTKLTDVPLLRIGRDGSVCWAFNVPYATIQDRFNIRITNESAKPGSMILTLYGPDGNEAAPTTELVNVKDENGNYIFLDRGGKSQLKSEVELGRGTGTDLNLLMPQETIHLNSEKLEKVLGASWSGRAVLRVTSKLPELEMLALLRNQLMDDASQPLNNLSLGAHGDSCD